MTTDNSPSAAPGFAQTDIDTFKSKLSDSDHAHLKALGLFASVVKGAPWRTHLKALGAPAAVCGKKPGGKSIGSTHRNRAGWNVYASIEGRGRELCEVCLKAAESLPPGGGSKS